MKSDQDVLTALLCSSDFSDIPVKILKRGFDILQCLGLFGFTVAERVRCMIWGLPIFIHALGLKPWLAGTEIISEGAKDRLQRKVENVYIDLSPYTIAAIAIAPTECGTWVEPRSEFSLVLRKAGFGYAPLVGLPIAVACDFIRFSYKIMRHGRRIVKKGWRR